MTGWQCETLNIATRSKKSFLAQLGYSMAAPLVRTIVDGRNPANQLRLVVCPIIYI